MKKTILITNDDGIAAGGLKYLISFLKPFGEVVVVAPDVGMSGMGHAVTIKTPLRITEFGLQDGVKYYSTNGTPADCVKLAINQVLKRKPDFIASGINHGSNHSINVFYSGTMAAAIEGAMQNINSVGFSMCNTDINLNLEFLKPFVQKIFKNIIDNGLPDGICLNVNFPNTKKTRGIKVCSQSVGYWDECFDARIDTHKQSYFWLKGDFLVSNTSDDNDENALKNNFISIVPTKTDLTAYDTITKLKKQFF